MSNIDGLVNSTQPGGETRKAREFAGWKSRLSFHGVDGTHVECEIRYAKANVDTVFEIEGVHKVGPSGGDVRGVEGEEKTLEKQANGTWIEIDPMSVKYVQGDTKCSDCGEYGIHDDKEFNYKCTKCGKVIATDVAPFDATKLWDIKEDRPMDECTLDETTALGTIIPMEKMDEYGPNKTSGTKLYEVWGDSQSLKALADKLEKDKLGLYFPHVFRKGMTIHLIIATIVRFDNTSYMVFKTFGGPVKLSKPLKGSVAEPLRIQRTILVKPSLKKKVGV